MLLSRIITEDRDMIKNLKPLHPGTVLQEVYMKEMELNQSQLAELMECLPKKINEIVNGKRGISPEFALALEEAIGTSAEMWVRMQAEYDLWVTRERAA
jgi:addiction module HigA family antidote